MDLFGNKKRKAAEEAARQAAEQAKHAEEVRQWALKPLVPSTSHPPNFALQKSEDYFTSFECNVYEPSTFTHRVGGSSGASFRVARGLWVRSGGFASYPVTEEIMKHVTHGTVFVTSKRLVVLGDKSNIVIYLKDLIGLDPYSDGCRISTEKRKKPLTFITGSFFLYGYIMKVIEKYSVASNVALPKP
jgi:hypothetical protein